MTYWRRFLAVFLLCLVFPFGIWVELLGYELWGLILLLIGWAPPSYYFAIVFSSKVEDELP